ncbi:pentatricopeptide repeat-containing protein At3g22690-like [Zingiber officinale]|uniref:Pentatricopeptide repeat-containing protein n=1 Tax=Zingiber officinale TaxID=94328 RepID=A0A8J5KXB9_ZINOF|nr:pentatricopeptide repeat-containing protein At3g22690-like [Zingiber officinale]KAG6493099.1 hypothetical protein ZIOFF_048075 [Zingiber officinale]
MRYLYFDPRRLLAAKKLTEAWSSGDHRRFLLLFLESCSNRSQLAQVHARMIRSRLVEDTFAASRLLAVFTSPSAISNMTAARRLFDLIPQPNIFMWNSIIRGYTHHCAPHDALSAFKLLLRRADFPPDSYTFSTVSRACAQLGSLRDGSSVHAMATRFGFDSDMFVMSGFINFYSGCGDIDVARKVFDEMPQKDVVSWTSMISGYLQQNQLDEGFRLFDGMRKVGIEPNKFTLTSLLSACGELHALGRGSWLHSQIMEYGWEFDIDIGNSVISMYAKCGSLIDALNVFKSMPINNTATWNALISGLVLSGHHKEALNIYQEMTCRNERPDGITISAALSACAQLGNLQQGKLLHAFVEENLEVCDVFLGNALINMYAKCGDFSEAESIFREMPVRDVFSWTALISGYVQGNLYKEALTFFEEMQLSNVKGNEVTMVSLLSACSQLGALDQGKLIHAYIEENEIKKDVCLQNTLIDMYAKCGCTDVAMQIFHGMPHKDSHTWNAMIGGLATNGQGREAINLFNQMHELRDVKPDNVTFMAVLSACTHSGMVNEGLAYFNLMSELYGVSPGVEHYGCLIDLLARAGFIDEAVDVIKKMPLGPNHLIWGSILSACRIQGKVELAEKILQNIIKLSPGDEGAHALISNLYAEARRWDEVGQVRTLMGSKMIVKSPGLSSIEVDGAHEFLVEDRS